MSEYFSGYFKGRQSSFRKEYRGYEFSDAECAALFCGAEVSLYGLQRPNGYGTYNVRGRLSWLTDKRGNRYLGIEHLNLLNSNNSHSPSCYVHYDTISNPKTREKLMAQRYQPSEKEKSSYVVVADKHTPVGSSLPMYTLAGTHSSIPIGKCAHHYGDYQPCAVDRKYYKINAYNEKSAEGIVQKTDDYTNVTAYDFDDCPYHIESLVGTAEHLSADKYTNYVFGEPDVNVTRVGCYSNYPLGSCIPAVMPYRVYALKETPDDKGRLCLDCNSKSFDGTSPRLALSRYIADKKLSESDVANLSFVVESNNSREPEKTVRLCDGEHYAAYRFMLHKLDSLFKQTDDDKKIRSYDELLAYLQDGGKARKDCRLTDPPDVKSSKQFVIQTVTRSLHDDSVDCVYTRGVGSSSVNAALRYIANSRYDMYYDYRNLPTADSSPCMIVDNKAVHIHAVPVSKCDMSKITFDTPVSLRKAGESDYGLGYNSQFYNQTGLSKFVTSCSEFVERKAARSSRIRDMIQSSANQARVFRAEALLDRLSIDGSVDMQYGDS